MNILQRIAALCGRDYVLMPLHEPHYLGFYILPIYWYTNWLENTPFARLSDGGHVRIDLNSTYFLTPRIKQWAQAQETTRRLEGEAQNEVRLAANEGLYAGIKLEHNVFIGNPK